MTDQATPLTHPSPWPEPPPYGPDYDLIGEREPSRYKGKHRRSSFRTRLRRFLGSHEPDWCEWCVRGLFRE